MADEGSKTPMSFMCTPGVPGTHKVPGPPAGDPDWVTKPKFVTDWSIVKNTIAYKHDAAKIDPVLVKLTSLSPRPTRPRSEVLASSGLLSPDELELVGKVDDELRVKGLRFHHAFFALEPPDELTGKTSYDAAKGPRDKVARVAWFRKTYVDTSGISLQPETAPELKSARDALAQAEKDVIIIRGKLRSSSATMSSGTDLTSQPAESDLADAEERKTRCKEWVDYLETSKAGTTYSFEGSKKFNVEDTTTAETPGRSFDSIAPLEKYIRDQLPRIVQILRERVIDSLVPKESRNDKDKIAAVAPIADEFVTMAIITFGRYFNREGSPNAINTKDGTFTYGVGFNTYGGGAGVDLLEAFAEPDAYLVNVLNRDALTAAREFLVRCGIAILPKRDFRTPNVRILHFEGTGKQTVPYVLDTVENAPTPAKPPPLPPKPKKLTEIDERLRGEAEWIYNSSVARWQEECETIKRRNNERDRLQSLEYLRHNEQLLKAWIMLGSKGRPPTVPKDVNEFRIVSALIEVGFGVFVNKTADACTGLAFPMWYLVRAGRDQRTGAGKMPSGTAAFTFLHHIAWWGWGLFENVTAGIQWSISRGFVVTRVATHFSEGLKDPLLSTSDSIIEAKDGATYKKGDKTKTAMQAPDVNPRLAWSVPLFTDDATVDVAVLRGEVNASELTRVLVADTLDTPVGLVRGMFTYLELCWHLIGRSDTTYWMILCKLWSNFISDLKEERDIKLDSADKIQLPREIAEIGPYGPWMRPAHRAKDGKWFVTYGKHEVEVPPSVRIVDGKAVTRLVADSSIAGGKSVAAEAEGTQARLARALGKMCPTFPFETVNAYLRRREDELEDELTLIFTPSPPSVGTITRGKDNPISLDTEGYARLQAAVRTGLPAYAIVELKPSDVGASKRGSAENADGDSDGAVGYLSDLEAGFYIVALKRDAQELDVGKLPVWSALYKLRAVKVSASPSSTP